VLYGRDGRSLDQGSGGGGKENEIIVGRERSIGGLAP